MSKPSTNYEVTKYLDGKDFIFGGQIARDIHFLTNTKESVVERRCRELADPSWCKKHLGKDETVLIKTYSRVNGKGPECVMYKLRDAQPVPSPTYNKVFKNGEWIVQFTTN